MTPDNNGAADLAALAGVAIAGVLALFLAPGPWSWFSTVIGIILLVVLWAYDPIEHPTFSQELAFSMVYGLCTVLISGVFFVLISPDVPFSRSDSEILCQPVETTIEQQRTTPTPTTGQEAREYRCEQGIVYSLWDLRDNWSALTWAVATAIVLNLPTRHLRNREGEGRRYSRQQLLLACRSLLLTIVLFALLLSCFLVMVLKES